METTNAIKLNELPKKIDKPLSVIEGMGVAEYLLEALLSLHNSKPQIIHRAVRPQNLVLTADGKVKLTAANDDTDNINPNQTNINYLPLEQIWNELDTASQQVILRGCDDRSAEILLQPLDVRCDIYSLGATLYNLMTGTTPPDALTRIISIIEKNEDPLVPPHTANPRINKDFSEIMMSAMQIMREHRFNSAAVMLHIIKTARMKLNPVNPVALRSGKSELPSKRASNLEDRLKQIRAQRKDFRQTLSSNQKIEADKAEKQRLIEIAKQKLREEAAKKAVRREIITEKIVESAATLPEVEIEETPVSVEQLAEEKKKFIQLQERAQKLAQQVAAKKSSVTGKPAAPAIKEGKNFAKMPVMGAMAKKIAKSQTKSASENTLPQNPQTEPQISIFAKDKPYFAESLAQSDSAKSQPQFSEIETNAATTVSENYAPVVSQTVASPLSVEIPNSKETDNSVAAQSEAVVEPMSVRDENIVAFPVRNEPEDIFSSQIEIKSGFPRFALVAAGILLFAAAAFGVWFAIHSSKVREVKPEEVSVTNTVQKSEETSPAPVTEQAPVPEVNSEAAAATPATAEQPSQENAAAAKPPATEKEILKNKTAPVGKERSRTLQPTPKPAVATAPKPTKSVTVDDIINDN